MTKDPRIQELITAQNNCRNIEPIKRSYTYVKHSSRKIT
jgi:hypothetical protein